MKITITRMIAAFALLFIMLCSFPIYYSYLQLTEKVQAQGESDFKTHVISTASDIALYINYFQLHTDDLANNPDIKTLASFWNDDDIQEWTIKTRKVLPQTVGLAIFNYKAEILGDSDQQKIGKGCLLDAHNFIHGQSMPLPPVHNNIHIYRHFDLYAEVKTENDEPFLLVHTIHLDFIERLLKRHALNNEHYLIVNSLGESIVEHGEINNGFSYTASIPGTDWSLKGSSILSNVISIKDFSGTIVFQVLVILIILTLLISYAVIRLLQHDKKILNNLMSNMGDMQNIENYQKPLLYDFNSLVAVIDEKNNRLNQAIEKIKKMALEDNLTHTGNRRLFDKEKAMHLSHAKRGMSICVAALDLDNFKEVNDKYGHAIGDKLLSAFGNALNSDLRDSDSVYRFGGDEFIVVLYSIVPENLTPWYDRLKIQFNNECTEAEIKLDIDVGISAGASVLLSSDASVYETILRADKALYESKQKGRGQITVSE